MVESQRVFKLAEYQLNIIIIIAGVFVEQLSPSETLKSRTFTVTVIVLDISIAYYSLETT